MRRLIKFVLAVVVIVVIVAIIAGHKSTPTSTNTAHGAAAYKVTGLSKTVLDTSHLSLDFDVTNVGNAEGTPGCVITATASSGLKSVGSALLSSVKIGDVDVALNQKVTIRDSQAASVPLSGIKINCS